MAISPDDIQKIRDYLQGTDSRSLHEAWQRIVFAAGAQTGELSAIRREVGADESRCQFCELPPARHCPIDQSVDVKHVCHLEHHAFLPESTLAAVQRMAKERVSDDCAVRITNRMLQDHRWRVLSNPSRQQDYLVDIIRQARGTAKDHSSTKV